MGLSSRQKQYIKKNIRALPLEKIALELELSEKDILRYLKKKWSPEKYSDFVSTRQEDPVLPASNGSDFKILAYLSENRFVFIGLIFLVFLAYANSVGNSFVSDDIPTLMKNPEAGKFGYIFSGPFRFSPRLFLNFLTVHMGGLHPASFRIISILFHAGSTVLIFLIVSLLSSRVAAIAAASLFAVHPILIESVTWISGAPYSQYSFFFLFSFLFYILSKQKKKYIYYSFIFFVLSILSSEKAIVLFLIFFLYEISFGSARINWKKFWPFAALCLGMAVYYLSQIGYRSQAIAEQTYQNSQGMFNPLVQIPVAIANYFQLIFWPDKLSLYQTELTLSKFGYIICVIVILTYFSLLAWTYFKNKRYFFWLAFFFITLLPTLTPLKVSWVVAERYVYLGTLGIIVAVAMLLEKLIDFNKNGKMIGYFLLVLAVASLSVRTIIRNRDWRNEDTLWVATARVSPSGQQIHNNLGDMYARQGDLGKSAEEFKKAIEINPGYADAYHNLGRTYQQMGQVDAAAENFQKALTINPKIWQSYQSLAAIYFAQGKYDLAKENIKKALEINPNDPSLQDNLKYIEENGK